MNRRFYMGGQLFTAQALALFGRMTTPPSFTRQRQIDVLIRALLSAGVWDLLDVLYVLAGADSQASLLNWKGATYSAANGGATFTADRGFTGDGASAYLTTGYTIGDAQSTNADHCFGVWARTSGTGWTMGAADPVPNYLAGFQGSTAFDSSISITAALGGGTGLLSATRDSTADFDGYLNGAFAATSAAGVFSPGPGPLAAFTLLARNVGGTIDSFYGGQISAAHMGASLTAGQLAALYAALAAYMTAVGA